MRAVRNKKKNQHTIAAYSAPAPNVQHAGKGQRAPGYNGHDQSGASPGSSDDARGANGEFVEKIAHLRDVYMSGHGGQTRVSNGGGKYGGGPPNTNGDYYPLTAGEYGGGTARSGHSHGSGMSSGTSNGSGLHGRVRALWDGMDDDVRARAEKQLQELQAEYKGAVAGLNADRETLQKEVQRVLALEREREKELNEEKAERDALAAEMHALKRSVMDGHGAEALMHQLNAELEGHKAERRGQLARIQHLEGQLRSRPGSGRSAGSAGGGAGAAAVAREVSELRQAVEGLEAQLANERRNLKTLQAEKAAVASHSKAELATLRAEHAEVREVLAGEVSSLQARLAGLAANSAGGGGGGGSAALQAAQDEVERLRLEAHQLRTELQKGDAAGKGEREEIAKRHRESLERMQALAEKSEKEREEAEEALEALEAEADELREKLSKAEGEARAAMDEASQLSNKADVVKAQEEGKYEAHRKGLQKRVDELEAEVARLGGELKGAMERSETDGGLRKQLEDMNRKLVEEAMAVTNVEKSMQREMRMAKTALEATSSERDALAEELKDKETTLERLEADLLAATTENVEVTARANESSAEAARLAGVEAENVEVKKDLWNLKLKHENLEEELASAEGRVAEGRRLLDEHVAAAGKERAELVREVHENVGELRKEARALAGELEGVRGTLGRQLEDSKSRAASDGARQEAELRRLREEREDLEDRAKRAAGEASVLTRESEALVKEKEALVREINLRAQELVESRAEGEGKRRMWQQEKEELERQMYLLSKDREEQLAKFRTERNGWSDRIREAKLKTAKDDATVKNKLSAVEAERSGLEKRCKDLEDQVAQLKKYNSQSERMNDTLKKHNAELTTRSNASSVPSSTPGGSAEGSARPLSGASAGGAGGGGRSWAQQQQAPSGVVSPGAYGAQHPQHGGGGGGGGGMSSQEAALASARAASARPGVGMAYGGGGAGSAAGAGSNVGMGGHRPLSTGSATHHLSPGAAASHAMQQHHMQHSASQPSMAQHYAPPGAQQRMAGGMGAGGGYGAMAVAQQAQWQHAAQQAAMAQQRGGYGGGMAGGAGAYGAGYGGMAMGGAGGYTQAGGRMSASQSFTAALGYH